MRSMREKLKSQSGASILMALLFFLLCAMVGASVLMAAASNAGKSRSNRQEQQKYLTLSSAMRLVCDELTGAKYTPECKITSSVPIKDGEGGTIGTAYTYTQSAGSYEPYGLGNALPLLPELEQLFGEDAEKEMAKKRASYVGNQYYFRDTGVVKSSPTVHTLILTVNADQFAADDQVKVQVKLGEGKVTTDRYWIHLSAELVKHPEYKMYAVLTLKDDSTITVDGTSSVSWELSQITKQEGDHAVWAES